MKLLVIIAGFAALCAGEEIPTIPGDNSHYVEGKSRYIWMPDGKGVPHLVDLQVPVDKTMLRSDYGASNQYWLYTIDNPTEYQLLVHGDNDSITDSNYLGTRPTKVIVHGWNNNGNSDVNLVITGAFLSVEDCNVIVVDWSDLAGNLFYPLAVAGVPSIGEYLGNFLIWLFDTAGGDWNTLHLVGHSLGAHVVGKAGRTAGGKPIRVTGCDPAGPLWGSNDEALNTSSGQYVEGINTDGGVLGIFDPISDANFYPNGGRNPQPGCFLSTCSHSRSYELFAATVVHNNQIGYTCSDTDEAEALGCTGSTLYMGNNDLTKTGSGIFGLSTGSVWPYDY